MTLQLLFLKNKAILVCVCLFPNRCPHRWGRFPGLRSVTPPKQLAPQLQMLLLSRVLHVCLGLSEQGQLMTPCHPFRSIRHSLCPYQKHSELQCSRFKR